MSFDFSIYLQEILSGVDDTTSKYYIETTSKCSSTQGLSSDSREYAGTMSVLSANVLDNRSTLLIGKPGAGKSTALKRLLYLQAKSYLEGRVQRIPILLELRRIGGSGFDGESTSLSKLIQSKLYSAGINDSKKIEQLLRSGDLLLLLDGLNEMPLNSLKLNDFIQDYPKTIVVVTTREFGHERYLEIDSKVFLQPLKEHQSQEFIKKRFRDINKNDDELLNLKHDKLRELLEIPLLLNMLCDTYL